MGMTNGNGRSIHDEEGAMARFGQQGLYIHGRPASADSNETFSTVNPATRRKVKAARASGEMTGWQAVKMRPRSSSSLSSAYRIECDANVGLAAAGANGFDSSLYCSRNNEDEIRNSYCSSRRPKIRVVPRRH